MPRKTYRMSVTLIVFTALMSVVAFSHADQASPFRIVATTTQVSDLTRVLTAGIDQPIEVESLMGPGVDPHLFVASAGDVALLSQADVIFYNGLDLEGKLDQVFEQMNRIGIPTIPATDAMDEDLLLQNADFAFNYDPHIWFDARQWQAVTAFLRDQLIGFLPAAEAAITANAADYLNELDVVHRYVLDQAERLTEIQRVLITSHDAFNYFGRAYGFEVRGIQGASTTSEASVADIQALADFIVEREIRAIFSESSVSSQTVNALREAVRDREFEVTVGEEIYSDAMGDPDTAEGTYLGMLRHNIDAIVTALLGEHSDADE